MLNGDYNLVGNFNFCHPKDQIIDLDFESADIVNYLNNLKKFEDEYNFAYSQAEPIIVYSINGLNYTTSCIIFNEIFVPASFSRYSCKFLRKKCK